MLDSTRVTVAKVTLVLASCFALQPSSLLAHVPPPGAQQGVLGDAWASLAFRSVDAAEAQSARLPTVWPTDVEGRPPAHVLAQADAGGQVPWPNQPGLPQGAGQTISLDQVLGEIIAAMQNCGPPHVYARLSAELHRLVLEQTQGTGCYPGLQAVGRLLELRLVEAQDRAEGPRYAVQGVHEGATVDYVISFDQATGAIVEWTFAYVPGQAPQQVPYQNPTEVTPVAPAMPTETAATQEGWRADYVQTVDGRHLCTVEIETETSFLAMRRGRDGYFDILYSDANLRVPYGTRLGRALLATGTEHEYEFEVISQRREYDPSNDGDFTNVLILDFDDILWSVNEIEQDMLDAESLTLHLPDGQKSQLGNEGLYGAIGQYKACLQ